MLNIYIHLIQYAIYILILTEYTRVCLCVIFIITSHQNIWRRKKIEVLDFRN
jgi:hypothetical protein